ncbi:hypothetical protein WICPIJ_006459 [Wickerhamomyces pijperi]|uniref:Translation initiation factor IF-2, mitochondrial n=1 Tax=Wickerhamomyces pijperi TaxID=599730 RepID=A0A9P8Q488_WICPI|nr:hypothetical protein WICPIJ_006459 [Wickerhamomyces pijperi]
MFTSRANFLRGSLRRSSPIVSHQQLRLISFTSSLQAKKQSSNSSKHKAKPKITLPPFTTISNLSNLLNVRYEQLTSRLTSMGFEENLTHNFILDQETSGLIADEYGFEVNYQDLENLGPDLKPTESKDIPEKLLKPRPPIVTIMGHVDHGKTTILDYLRKSSIVQGEHGGITQHIGAFSVKTPVSKKLITFLDTPGHAAFLKMRERGAVVTDIVILVVAADDSVMPQTKEAIKHIKKTGVQVIVAVNKCDKENANPDKVIRDLAENEIDVEDYGGEVQTVRVSGLTGLNMDKLEESIITLSEIMDLKASKDKKTPVEGWVIESKTQKGMGALATVLITQGTLTNGDVIVAGGTYCKVRSMKDEAGKIVKQAPPSTPVEIWGWKELPEAGELVLQAKDEKLAKQVVETRQLRASKEDQVKDIESLNQMRMEEKKDVERREKIEELKKYGLDSSDLEGEAAGSGGGSASDGSAGPVVVNYIIKSDVSGSAEAIVESLENLGNEEVKLNILYSGVGAPTESDLERAELANATILLFNVNMPKDIDNKAYQKQVSIQQHTVIYHLIEAVTEELSSKLAPTIELRTLSETEVKEIFEIRARRKKVIKIAGCRVINGVITRSSKIRVMRDGEEIYRGKLETLKHLKDDVVEVKKGRECGLSCEGFEDFKQGDIIECFEEKEIPRYL